MNAVKAIKSKSLHNLIDEYKLKIRKDSNVLGFSTGDAYTISCIITERVVAYISVRNSQVREVLFNGSQSINKTKNILDFVENCQNIGVFGNDS